MSNCNAPSRRGDYVRELQKYVDVDVFGACGTKTCPKPTSACLGMLNKEYRFYLAFENSVCNGYITEKLWQQGLSAHVIPVVLSAAIVAPYLPNDSFLAVDQYKTVKQFADVVKQLMTDDAAYTKMALDWRRSNRVVFLDGQSHDIHERPWGFCRLCHIVQQQPRPQHIIDSFNKWSVVDGHCDHGQIVSNILSNSKGT